MPTGKYVNTFAEATHALPQGMHMNADYPFMLPKCEVRIDGKLNLYADRGSSIEVIEIKHDGMGEYFILHQSSSFETMFNRKPTRFKFLPFKDEFTEVATTAAEGGR